MQRPCGGNKPASSRLREQDVVSGIEWVAGMRADKVPPESLGVTYIGVQKAEAERTLL